MSTNTMRVISQDDLGGPEVLKEVEVERPTPRPNEVLVRVRAAGVNPTDWKSRSAMPRRRNTVGQCATLAPVSARMDRSVAVFQCVFGWSSTKIPWPTMLSWPSTPRLCSHCRASWAAIEPAENR